MAQILHNSKLKISQGQISWREIGRKKPNIIFLHDAFSDSSEWIPLLQELGQDYHCFAIDLLGFGVSESPDIHYSIQLQIECLSELIKNLNLDQFYLVGQGLGGWIAASFALKYADDVTGLILISPIGVKPEKKPFGLITQLLINAPAGLFSWLNNYKYSNFLGIGKIIKNLLKQREDLIKNTPSYQLLYNRKMVEINAELLEQKLEFLKTKTLILAKSEDKKQSENFAQILPISRLEYIHINQSNAEEMEELIIAKHIKTMIK